MTVVDLIDLAYGELARRGLRVVRFDPDLHGRPWRPTLFVAPIDEEGTLASEIQTQTPSTTPNNDQPKGKLKMKIEYTKTEPIPEGVYDATVSSIESVTGQFGPQLKFTFEITDGDYAARKMGGWTSVKLSKKSKLNDWCGAILFGGHATPTDYVLDTDELLKRPVRLVIRNDFDKEGEEFNRIDKLIPLKPKVRTPQTKAPATPPAPPVQMELQNIENDYGEEAEAEA